MIALRDIFSILLFIIVVPGIFGPDLKGQEIELFGHLDEHGFYSSCWGYAAPDGREYAIVGTLEGTIIVDITDSKNLTEVAFIEGPVTIWREMKTYSHYAYIVSDGEGWGLQIVDLSSLPDSVSFVKNWTYPGFTRAHTISQEGPYLYLNGGNASENGGIAILSLADPVNPVKVGEWTEHYVHDSHIRNDTIYASGVQGDGLTIIDATDKSNPQLIAQVMYPNAGTHNAWTTDDGNYVITTDEINHPDLNLKIWDIRDLDKIEMVADYTLNPDAIVHNVYVRGEYAHVAWYSEGYVVVDISDPENPVLADSYDTNEAPHGEMDGAWNVYPFFPSGKIILSDMETGLWVFFFHELTTDVPGSEAQTPTDYVLHQNYPNPFNPTTHIRFELPVRAYVILNIYDLLGREVATIVNEEKAPGTYEIEWNAAGMAGGIYFYRLQTEEAVITRKLLLLK